VQSADKPNTSPVGRQASDVSDESGNAGSFRLRQVRVHELLEDGTLGLLLHGTSVVGFCSSQADSAGWAVGDQIVEVNGHRVAMFDEFIDRFVSAQEDGFPIEFSVLRREQEVEETEGAEDALEGFFSATNFVDLAGQLQKKFAGTSMGQAPMPNPPPIPEEDSMQFESITENPYIQALRKRRTELCRNAEGWASEVAESLAARLATQRSDALASLTRSHQKHPGFCCRRSHWTKLGQCNHSHLRGPVAAHAPPVKQGTWRFSQHRA